MAGVYSVTQINTYLKNLFARDYPLQNVTIRGEVSNCKYHSAGHIFFTLKDASSSISCVMFQTYRQKLAFRLNDGMEIEAGGQVAVYEKNGTYQLYVREARMSGQGELFERYLRLKSSLEERGYFDPGYKKKIPPYSLRIGVVTSETGAAIRDIANVSRRRNPYSRLFLMPALVQGEHAAADIADSIRRLDRMGMDVIIVGRGGGSIEDLWPFNEVVVAEAIFDCVTPVISAVGHETDFTIADFVADLRAPTPSAAAELANFDYEAFLEQKSHYESRMRSILEYRIGFAKEKERALEARLGALNPGEQLKRFREQLREKYKRMRAAMDHRFLVTRERYGALAGRLDAASPLKKLTGGFGYVAAGGKPLESVSSVKRGDRLTTVISDGTVVSVVEEIQMRESHEDRR